MNFKEIIQSDIDRVFLNAGEFADERQFLIGGSKITCPAVVESVASKARSARQSDNYEGMYGSGVTVYVKKADLPEAPPHGEVLRLDGKLYLVDTCEDEGGMLVIRLEANDS